MINKNANNRSTTTGCFDFIFGCKNNNRKKKIEECIPTPYPQRKNKSKKNGCNQEYKLDNHINKYKISNQKKKIKPPTPPINRKNIKKPLDEEKTNLNMKTNVREIDKNLTSNNGCMFNSRINQHKNTIFGLVLNGSLARRAMNKSDYKSQKKERENLMLKRDHTFRLLERAYAKNCKANDAKEIIKLKERIDTLKMDIIGYSEKINAINEIYY